MPRVVHYVNAFKIRKKGVKSTKIGFNDHAIIQPNYQLNNF